MIPAKDFILVSGPNLNCRCRHCGKVISYSQLETGLLIKCPSCRNEITLPGRLQTVAARRRTRKNTPVGLALEITGFILLAFFPIGTVLGVVAIFFGWKRSIVRTCGNCQNPLPAINTKSCSSCRALLIDE